MKLDPGAKLQPRKKRYKRTQIEIRYDERGLDGMIAAYKKYRTYMGENEAECSATGATTDAGRRLWRKRARQGEQPFYEIFSAFDKIEEESASAKVPKLFDEIEKRDPYKAYGLHYPRLKYRRMEEARRIAVDQSHAMVVRQLVDGLSEHFDKVLSKKTAREAAAAMWDYVQAFEGDLTDARTVGKVEDEDGEDDEEQTNEQG